MQNSCSRNASYAKKIHMGSAPGQGVFTPHNLGQTQLVSSVVKPPKGFVQSQRGREEGVLPVLQDSGSPLGPQDVQKVPQTETV